MPSSPSPNNTMGMFMRFFVVVLLPLTSFGFHHHHHRQAATPLPQTKTLFRNFVPTTTTNNNSNQIRSSTIPSSFRSGTPNVKTTSLVQLSDAAQGIVSSDGEKKGFLGKVGFLIERHDVCFMQNRLVRGTSTRFWGVSVENGLGAASVCLSVGHNHFSPIPAVFVFAVVGVPIHSNSYSLSYA
jgi:hypothetical protein